ncbi:nuclear transport factor 2 family protein [Parapedomonas caeni]
MTSAPILHRRAVLASALAVTTTAVPTPVHAATPAPRLLPVLQALISAWHRLDVEGVLALVTDDIVWQNSGGYAPAIEGKPAMREALQGMARVIRSNHWRLFDVAEAGDRLFMEGVDEFHLVSGQHIALPYAGVLEFRAARIRRWREYYDGRLAAAMKAGGPIPAAVRQLIDRPALG